MVFCDAATVFIPSKKKGPTNEKTWQRPMAHNQHNFLPESHETQTPEVTPISDTQWRSLTLGVWQNAVAPNLVT